MDRSTHPLQTNRQESHVPFEFNVVFLTVIAVLLAYIQVSMNTTSALLTHYANMITSLISFCLYVCVIMLRMIVKAEHFTCSVTIFNYALVFSGILTPVSLVSVFLPYRPLGLGFFSFALFLIILAHCFFTKIKVAVDAMFTRLRDLASGAVEIFNTSSSSTSAGISAHGNIKMHNIPPSITTPTGSHGA